MATQQKMFCKVCYDAKKKEHTSHNVRDRSGKVVCPTLLSQKCKYCKKFGHTPSHCDELKGKYKNSEAKREAKPEAKREAKPDMRERTRRLFSSPSPPPPPLPLVERARRLCESPPPPPSLSENFPIIGQTDSGKIVRPAPMKINVWAKVVAQYRPDQQEQQAPAVQVQAPKKSQAPEPEEAPKEQAEVPIIEEVPIANEAEVPITAVKTGYVPEAYSGCWADM